MKLTIWNEKVMYTWRGIEQAPSSQTLKFFRTNLSLEPTSHNPTSPTFVPTEASQQETHERHIRYEKNSTITNIDETATIEKQ